MPQPGQTISEAPTGGETSAPVDSAALFESLPGLQKIISRLGAAPAVGFDEGLANALVCPFVLL
jgi:hypothetical protein